MFEVPGVEPIVGFPELRAVAEHGVLVPEGQERLEGVDGPQFLDEIRGLGELARELSVLSKAGRWEEMPDRISDDILHEYVTIGTYDEIGDRLIDRYGDVVTSIEFSIPAATDNEKSILGGLVQQVRAAA